MGIIRPIRLERIRVLLQAEPPQSPPETPPMYEAALRFFPAPDYWWRVTFGSYFSRGGCNVLEWKGPHVKVECRMHDLALIPAAITTANEDLRQYAPQLEEWDRGYEAFCKGEPPPPHSCIELTELDMKDFVPVEPGAGIAEGEPASNDAEQDREADSPLRLPQG